MLVWLRMIRPIALSKGEKEWGRYAMNTKSL